MPTGSLPTKPVVAESLLDRMIHTIHTVPTDTDTAWPPDAGQRRPGHGFEYDPATGVDIWVLMRAPGLSGSSS